MKFFSISLSLLLFVVSLTACGAGASSTSPPVSPTPASLLTDPEEATQEAITLTPTATPAVSPELATSTPIPSPTSPPEPTATNTPVPTPTTPPVPTATPEPVVQLAETSTNQVNVRSGPSTDYPVVGQLSPGQTAAVVGRNADSSWWQINWGGSEAAETPGWVFGELVNFSGNSNDIALVEVPPPPPTPTPQAPVEAVAEAQGDENSSEGETDSPPTSEELADQLRCGKDFCVTYQAMVPMLENGGCVGNHSIYITVLEGPPPGRPMDGVVVGDTYNNVEVASGSNGPGHTEITLWNNSMTLIVKRHQNGTPYTSEESFNFTSHDELIPAEVLAVNGYCEGDVEKCRWAQQHNQVCRGHYSWRVTFHKFD